MSGTSTTTGGDGIHAYLAQIGRVPLLTPCEERALCADIEKARAALAAALLAHPSSAARLAGLCAAVRLGAATTDELLQSAEGARSVPTRSRRR